MAHPHPTPRRDSDDDDAACARHVILNADKLSLMTPEERMGILKMAWNILTAKGPRHSAAPKTGAETAGKADPKVISLAVWKARQRIRARAKARAALNPSAPRRPRIVVRPAHPSDPKDAA